MKTLSFLLIVLGCTGLQAQEHFAGINTSKRTGLLNANFNPAELVNIATEYEINVISVSANVSNNKLGFNEVLKSKNIEEDIFSGTAPASFRIDTEILGPAFAMKVNKWAFSIATVGKSKANIIDINNQLGLAVIKNNTPESIDAASALLVDYDQKASALSWGEINLSAARELFNNGEHAFNAGITFKLLMPGSYARMNASNFRGTIALNPDNQQASLTDASSNVNFAYNGSLANNFSDVGNFANYFGNGIHGFATDFGVNYRWLNQDEGGYKINAGVSFRNMGSMTFKDSNNQSNNYTINVPQGQYLNLQQFSGQTNIQNIENLLIQSGFAQINKQSTDFKLKTPATFNAYADVKVYNNWYISAFTQQKLSNDGQEDQIAVQNVFTVTPRYSMEKFEVFLPLSDNEISNFTAGIGLRYGGFFIGSGSFITALFNNTDTHQADGYIGYRFGF